MEIKDRFTTIKKHFKLSNAQLGEIAEASSISISNIEQGITESPKLSIFQNIADKLGVSLDWLLLGKGDMVKDQDEQAEQRYGKPKEASLYVTRPIITQQAASDYLTDFQSSEPYEHMAFIVLPGFEVTIRQYTVFQVKGESMAPTFIDSEYVICTRLEQREWPDLRAQDIFIVVSKRHGVQLSRFKNRHKCKGYLYFQADNGAYSGFFLKEEDILELWRFHWRLSPAAVNGAEQLTKRIEDLEDELLQLKQAIKSLTNQLSQRT